MFSASIEYIIYDYELDEEDFTKINYIEGSTLEELKVNIYKSINTYLEENHTHIDIKLNI